MRINFVSICLFILEKSVETLDNPPSMKTRVRVRINETLEIYKRLLSQRWEKLNQFDHKRLFT